MTKARNPSGRVRHRTRQRLNSELAQQRDDSFDEDLPTADAPDDYEVGYAKPPTHSQFKKGKSGNPKGRPKNARNFRSIIQQELDAARTIRRDGQQYRLPTRHIVVLRLIENALGGDLKAVKEVLALDDQLLDAAMDELREEDETKVTKESDRAIIDEMIRMIGEGQTNKATTKSDPTDAKRTDK